METYGRKEPEVEHLAKGALPFSQFLAWAGIRKSKAYDEAAKGRLRLTKVGSKTLVLRTDAEAWLAHYVGQKAAA